LNIVPNDSDFSLPRYGAIPARGEQVGPKHKIVLNDLRHAGRMPTTQREIEFSGRMWKHGERPETACSISK
jgi:hypothetical protein